MSALPDPLAPGTIGDRLVIRPQMPVVLIVTFAEGAMTAVTAGVLFATGGQPAALICIAVGVIAWYIMLGGHLWADAEQVGSTRAFEWWNTCRRDELAYLWVGAGYRSRQCSFMRKDGRIAFSTPAMVYGVAQLTQLANYLGVPIYDGLQRLTK